MTPSLRAWLTSGNFRSVVATAYDHQVVVMACQMGVEQVRVTGPVAELDRVLEAADRELAAYQRKGAA